MENLNQFYELIDKYYFFLSFGLSMLSAFKLKFKHFVLVSLGILLGRCLIELSFSLIFSLNTVIK